MDEQTIQVMLKDSLRIFPNADSVIISDTKRYLHYEASIHLDLHIKSGDLIELGSPTWQAITKRKRVRKVIEDEEVNMSYWTIAEPIFIGEMIIGAITAIYPLHTSISHYPYVTVRTEDRWIPIHLDDITFLEASNRKTYVVSTHCKGTHRENLRELEAKLPAENFLRCHRSYIVNLHQIMEIHPDSHSTLVLRMKSGERIPVSQNYSKHFRRLLNF